MNTAEVNDAIFCQAHLKEVVCLISVLSISKVRSFQCGECSYDGREENDSFFGVCFLLIYDVGLIATPSV